MEMGKFMFPWKSGLCQFNSLKFRKHVENYTSHISHYKNVTFSEKIKELSTIFLNWQLLWLLKFNYFLVFTRGSVLQHWKASMFFYPGVQLPQWLLWISPLLTGLITWDINRCIYHHWTQNCVITLKTRTTSNQVGHLTLVTHLTFKGFL